MAKDSGKPQLRGLLLSQIKVNIVTAFVAASIAAVGVKIFVGDARKKKYAEFYKTYDPEAHFERMRKAGLMQSAAP